MSSTTAAPSGLAFGSTSNALQSSSSSIGLGTSASPHNTTFVFEGATQGQTNQSMSSSSLFSSSITPTTTARFPGFGYGFITPNANNRPAWAPTWNNSIFKVSPPPHGFDFSTTPLHCFANIPSSSAAKSAFFSFFPTPFTTQSSSMEVGEKTNPFFFQEPKITTIHICKTCGSKSFWGQHWGSKVATYTPIPADSELFASKLISISAMPVYKDKSHDELRWEDYQLQGKTQGSFAPGTGNESAIMGQAKLVAVPVLMLPIMPNSSSCGFNVIP